MRPQLRATLGASLFALLLVCSVSVDAVVHQYAEDFTTTGFRDTLNTTADWSTLDGELRLPLLMSLSGSCDWGADAEALAVSGNYAYVAAEFALSVIDISDPALPSLAAECFVLGTARDLAIAGNRVYVATDLGLQVVDISNPLAPSVIGSYHPSGTGTAIALAGDYAYIAMGSGGLAVIDIEDPTNPTPRATCTLSDDALDVAIDGDHAYVATGGAGLSVVEVTHPDSLTLVATCPVPGDAMSVAVDGDYACVATGESGMHVVSVEDPLAPFVLGSEDTPGTATDVTLTGDYAYLVDASSVVRVISIDFPSDPRTIGTCVTPGSISGIELAGDHVYAVGTHGLHAIEIADIVAPPSLASTYDTSGRSRGVTVAGDYAYVGDRAGGFLVFDISDPENVTLAGQCETPDYAWQAAVAGDYAFLCCEAQGIYSVDISDPTEPVLLGNCPTPGHRARHCEVDGDYVYVADHVALQVIDVSDPANPTLAASCPPVSGAVRGVAVAGNYAYVNEEPFHLMVVDISDPENPWVAGRCEIPGSPSLYGVAVAGNYVFWAGTGTIVVIDVTDPTNPTLAGECHLVGTPREFAVSGNQLFVAHTQAGFSVVDITDPPNPVLLGSYATEWQARGLDVAGDYAFVGVYESGFYVFKVYERFDHAADTGRSLPVDALDDPFVRFRFSTAQVDSIAWELSMDGGTGWTDREPDWLWTVAPSLGSDLMWRSTHTYTGRGLNPACTTLALDWLYRFPIIDSVVDVPHDQGGRVRLHLTRSGYDFTEELDTPIHTYNVLRRVDGGAARALREPVSVLPTTEWARSGALRETGLPGRRFVMGGAGTGRGELPPGVWEILGSFAALQEQEYIYLAETLADSTEGGVLHSVYCVTAHTAEPSVWYCSYPDSGYSVDNIAPGVPTGFAVNYTIVGGNELAWDSCPDEDFQYFRVYRGESDDFEPAPENLLHMTAETEWTDPAGTGWHHYRISALDHVGNESDPAVPEATTGIAEAGTAPSFALYQNVPNPFNPTTTIAYDVPAGGGRVTIEVFDVAGRRVTTLVDERQDAGRRSVTWRGIDTDGNALGSGVYFYRMTADGIDVTKKMLLLK